MELIAESKWKKKIKGNSCAASSECVVFIEKKNIYLKNKKKPKEEQQMMVMSYNA